MVRVELPVLVILPEPPKPWPKLTGWAMVRVTGRLLMRTGGWMLRVALPEGMPLLSEPARTRTPPVRVVAVPLPNWLRAVTATGPVSVMLLETPVWKTTESKCQNEVSAPLPSEAGFQLAVEATFQVPTPPWRPVVDEVSQYLVAGTAAEERTRMLPSMGKPLVSQTRPALSVGRLSVAKAPE